MGRHCLRLAVTELRGLLKVRAAIGKARRLDPGATGYHDQPSAEAEACRAMVKDLT
jgi:hypothetical protein